MTIAERIRMVRQRKNISQSELARMTGINNKSLSRYELGATIPPADALKAIADALGVSADYLLDEQQTVIKDKVLFKKFEVIQEMQGETKEMVVNFLDLVIRDFKAKKMYG